MFHKSKPLPNPEQEPLLPKSHPSLKNPLPPTPSPPIRAESSPGPTLSVHHLASSLAALRAGALPSSAQILTLLKAIENSSLLEVEGSIFEPKYGHGRLGLGKLSREGEKVRLAVRQLVASIERIVRERNGGDQVQDFVVACKKSQLDLSAY